MQGCSVFCLVPCYCRKRGARTGKCNHNNGIVEVESLSACDASGVAKEAFSIHEPVFIKVRYRVIKPNISLTVGINLFTAEGSHALLSQDSSNNEWKDRTRECGWYESICVIPKDFLNNGEISVSMTITENGTNIFFHEKNVISFSILDDMQHSGARGEYTHEWPRTAVRPVMNWEINYYHENIALSVNSSFNFG